MSNFTLMSSKPLRTSLSTPRMPWMSIPPSTMAVLGGEDLGMVGVELELGAVLLLLTETEESLDAGLAMSAVHPFAARAPVELGGLGGLGECVARTEQRVDIYAVLHFFPCRAFLCRGHHCLLFGKRRTLTRGCIQNVSVR
jgi:hypothetical protein